MRSMYMGLVSFTWDMTCSYNKLWCVLCIWDKSHIHIIHMGHDLLMSRPETRLGYMSARRRLSVGVEYSRCTLCIWDMTYIGTWVIYTSVIYELRVWVREVKLCGCNCVFVCICVAVGGYFFVSVGLCVCASVRLRVGVSVCTCVGVCVYVLLV